MLNFQITSNGTLTQATIPSSFGLCEVTFRQDEYGGPRFYRTVGQTTESIELSAIDDETNSFTATVDSIKYSLRYEDAGDHLSIIASIENLSNYEFTPRRAGLRLGIDTYMEKFPDWNEQYFPTMLRCERNHFWGYFMTPSRKLLGIASPDAIAAWNLDYNFHYQGVVLHNGHRIYTATLDLLTTLPLPVRHPRGLNRLAPGEARTWRIHLKPLSSQENVVRELAQLTQAPAITLNRYTFETGEQIIAKIHSANTPKLQLTTPSGASETLAISETDRSGILESSFVAKSGVGLYKVTAETSRGAKVEATFFIRHPWSWYLQKAREAALHYPQKAATHNESWMGLYSGYLARKHFPNAKLDHEIDRTFEAIFPRMWDAKTMVPRTDPGRIQNTTCMISCLTDRFEASGEIEHLEIAAKMADWVIANYQDPGDGSYRGGARKGELGKPSENIEAGQISALDEWVHYTCVIYPAKSILELALAERRLGTKDPIWQERSERHFASAKKAIDELEHQRDDIGTEGELTFEDGMISCSALQLGMLGVISEDPVDKARYTEACADMLSKHACLEQNVVPDCRMRGATLRFWEFQYDVNGEKNLLNSPHAWSSFKSYATWYLYLLTGEERLLRETMDAVGALAQLINPVSGELSWAFTPDPLIETTMFEPDPNNPGQGIQTPSVVGEQYIPMISDWWRAPDNTIVIGHQKMTTPVSKPTQRWSHIGGCCDNDVHECFKCLEEVALRFAYVVEREDGSLHSWNCKVSRKTGSIIVELSEAVISAVHVNLQKAQKIQVTFTDIDKITEVECNGLQWISKDGLLPEAPLAQNAD